MNLDDLKSTWQHYKVVNGLQPIDNIEALILQGELESKKVNFQRVLINLMLFLMLTVFIQGG